MKISLETKGKLTLEHELLFICQIKDLKDLKKAKQTIEIEQWELKTIHAKQGVKGTIRVRKNDKEYTLATKNYRSAKGVEEIEQKITADFFNHFKILAPMGSIKVRHIFPIKGSNLKWEVDVFYDIKGNPSPWCKVDLEHNGQLKNIPEFPIKMLTVIPRNRTKEQDKFVTQLFTNVFQVYNEDNILPIETIADRTPIDYNLIKIPPSLNW